ncbi:MAG: glycosyltransferase family 39 protein [Planctomycetaceae bacterium]|nr:glycosyltransferase family 39 protein [Planctomycetaceae bacterium]
MDRSTGWQGWIMSPAIIAALFMLALSPLLVDHLLFHPDERHYVDAALQMQETGEWLTPRTADGELRLQKPILAYWFVAAGTSLWDPSPFSTRVLFLLTGGALIWWGARAAWEATGSRAATALTAFMLACHPALIISAVRSLPDVLLGTFVTMSLAGFVAIIARGRADWGPLLTAYLGGALAILAKGSPAIVFVAYGTLYIAYYRRTLFRSQWSRFAVAATLCCALGGSWFAAMHWRYGAELVEQFVVDQGHPYRFASDTLQVLLQGLLIALTLVLSFGLILFPAARPIWNRRRDAAAICSRPVNHFLIGWIGLFLACAACINHVSLRYLLPVAGPTAILLATLIVELEGPRMRRNLRGLAWVSLALIPIAATIVLLLSQN